VPVQLAVKTTGSGDGSPTLPGKAGGLQFAFASRLSYHYRHG